MGMSLAKLNSIIGEVFVFGTSTGVSRVVFGIEEYNKYIWELGDIELSYNEEVRRAASELELYFSGSITRFSSPVDLSGAASFQLRVWRELLKIPYGEVLTYGELARKVERPRAARAVGGALRANPVPILVPCHRVVSSGGLGGYYYGPAIKEQLLRLEGVDLS